MKSGTVQITQKEADKVKQLIYDMEMIQVAVEKEYSLKLNRNKDKIYNIFLLGPSGAGKSTIANELANVRIKFHSEDDETFQCKPEQNDNMMFKISPEAMISETDKPQALETGKGFKIIDLPGYFDCRCKYKDLKNIVYSQSLIRISENSQICIVIPASQFYDYNLEKLIKILNNIDKNGNEIDLTLIISMVNGQKLDYFIKMLEELLKTNSLQNGKELLQNILKQKRVILFDVPVQDPDDDIYQFDQKKIKQIQEQIFRKELFKKYDKIKLNPPDETKLTLQQIFEYYQNEIRSLKQNLSQNYLKVRIREMIWNKIEREPYNNYVKDLNNIIKNYEFFQQQFSQTSAQNKNEQIQLLENLEKQIDVIFDDFDLRKNNEYQKAYKQEDSLYIICTHLSSSELKQLLHQFSDIKNVFIFTLLVFRLDSDIVLPGISLYLQTLFFISEKGLKLQINLSGKDGGEFKPPKAGQSKINPQDGEEGQEGYEGQNGGNLFIDAGVFDIEKENLTINVSGGNGGQGQEGGDGREGKKGQDAVKINEKNRKHAKILETREIEQSAAKNYGTFSNTYERIYMSFGTPGEVGGNSGKGGLGGCGGKAGNVLILPPIELNNQQIDGQFGPDGIDGKPGKGGQIGRAFQRRFKTTKAFGHFRQHENLQQTQQVGSRIGVNVATLGLATVASVFGTAVKSMQNTKKWLDDGEYHDQDLFSENGNISARVQKRVDKEKPPQPFMHLAMKEFIDSSYKQLSGHKWVKKIFDEIEILAVGMV